MFEKDYSKVSLADYMNLLKNRRLVKSRQLIKDNIEKRFGQLKDRGIDTLKDLQKLLENKSQRPGLDNLLGDEYCKLLLREIKSNQPKSQKLDDFYLLDSVVVEKFKEQGISNTKKVYSRILNSEDREKLARELDMSLSEVEKLAFLCDLSRIQWVGATFACMLYECGYLTVADVVAANAEELHKEVVTLNAQKQIFKGAIGLNDMYITIESAKWVDSELEI